MNTRYRRQPTPLERINNSVTAWRAFRIRLGIEAAELLADITYMLVRLALLAGLAYGAWLLLESIK